MRPAIRYEVVAADLWAQILDGRLPAGALLRPARDGPRLWLADLDRAEPQPRHDEAVTIYPLSRYH